jgi:phosphatidyl-myo-inositol alpha-mannosyltransferase
VRVALTHPYSWPEVRRGAERIIHELSRALARRGHEVTVFTAGAAAGRTKAEGVTTVRFRRRFDAGARHERHFGLRLVAPLALGPFDAVHSLTPLDALASIRAARLRPGRRTVYTNLGIPLRGWWQGRYDGAAHDKVVAGIDAYGCMSRFALDALRNEYGRVGVLTPGGVNTREFEPAERRETKPTVLFSGAVAEPHKGLATLLAAVAIAGEQEPDLQLWISGPGDAQPLLDAAPEAARRRVTVLPLGEPGAQADRYGRAWATALPSKGDSFGMVLVESLACGTPIVGSTHSALPELVDAGVTGALCEPEDPPSVARALLEAIRLARDPRTVEACRTAARRYDWDNGIAPDLEALYAG